MKKSPSQVSERAINVIRLETENMKVGKCGERFVKDISI